MSSIRQIQANQLNARNSTGPRSVEGRAAVSLNALKSGIHANSRVIRGEDPEQLAALTTEYYHRWAPTTPEQRLLVDTLVSNDWLLRRLYNVEAQIWEFNMPNPVIFNPKVCLGQAYSRADSYLARLQQRINSAHRNFHNALRDLERLKNQPPPPSSRDPLSLNPTPIPPPSQQPIDLQPTSQPIGFVPQAAHRGAGGVPPGSACQTPATRGCPLGPASRVAVKPSFSTIQV